MNKHTRDELVDTLLTPHYGPVMNKFLSTLLTPHYGPGDGDGDAEGGGDTGTADRGDDFNPDGEGVVDEKDTDSDSDDLLDGLEAKAGDAEGEGDADADADKGDVDAEADKGGHLVPKARMDRALQRAQKAEAALEQKVGDTADDETAVTVDTLATKVDELADTVDELEDKIEEARGDGDAKAVAELRKERRTAAKELRTTERAYQQQVATEQADSSGNQTIQQVRYDKALLQVEADFPAINPDSKEYDQAVVDDVLELKEAFEMKGYTSSDALNRAVGYINKADGAPAGVEVSKRKTDVAKNLDANNKQPPNMDKAGKDSDKAGAKDTVPNAADMTDAEREALPEETRKRMRGDFV